MFLAGVPASGIHMAMQKIAFDKAKNIAKIKGLKPGKVKGTSGVQFTKGTNNRLDVITWRRSSPRGNSRSTSLVAG